MSMAIPPAQLISCHSHVVPGKLKVSELFFSVPLDYAEPEGKKLRLFARSVEPITSSATACSLSASQADTGLNSQRPWLVYLSGGPGFGARPPQDYSFTDFILKKGYQMLYFDHRGMGLSTPITAATLAYQAGSSPANQAKYLKHFRADSAVKDLEAIRQELTASSSADLKKWSVMGQSYGGFVAISYLSRYPDGLREVFTTGGLPPVTAKGPDEVYERLVEKVQERNRAYFKKFPEDGYKVRTILEYLHRQEATTGPVVLPDGGLLTAGRFMQIGIWFGYHGGLDTVHDVVLTTANDLEIFGSLTRPTLSRIAAYGAFDNHPLYAVLHEPIYCQGGVAPNWAAERVVKHYPNFDTRSNFQQVYFTGEMIFKHNFEDSYELAGFAAAAMLLADTTDWTELYDIEQLRRNEVPVYSSTYIDDMYVDFRFAQETADLIQGCKTFVTNTFYHNAWHSKSEELMKALFALKEDSLD